MSSPKIEDGVIVGTSSNKYESRNPAMRYLVAGFDRAITSLLAMSDASNVLEIGAGEGHVTDLILEHTEAKVHATDISEQVIGQTSRRINSDRVTFDQLDIADEPDFGTTFDLIVCCEVLEHIDDPKRALEYISRSAPFALLSVPREPIFRGLNVLRGAYLSDWGNSPGHIQHWSASGFVALIEQYFDIHKVTKPLPWTALYGKSKRYSAPS